MRSTEKLPKIGDMVYCHAVGSKYGWYIDQLGIILDITNVALCGSQADAQYKIWLNDQQRVQLVEHRDFTIGNIEVVTREKGMVFKGRRFFNVDD